MSVSRRLRRAVAGPMALACCLIALPGRGRAQTARPVPGSGMTISSLEELARMSPQELEALYRRAGVGVMPEGRVRGLSLVSPGSRMAVPLSRGARAVWQGKVFKGDGTAVNRFFGVRIIRGQLSRGPSWLDGGPSLILDYQDTSRLYRNFRDEIRQVGPNIYLGLMYDRTKVPRPTVSMYFAFQSSS